MARALLAVDDYVKGIRNGDLKMLSKAITLVESTRTDHQQVATEVVAKCQPFTGNGLRIGITGPPGVGKSTFIDALGALLIEKKKRIAVLAIDPSSKISGGSILGDKTRMTRLAGNPDAFIRPSPNSGASGGLSDKTRESLILCEAAGYDVVLIETVGIGQSEFEVHSMVDLVILLLITGAGDDLQGIKRGIMEMADLIVVNKADGPNKNDADLLSRSLKQTMKIMPASRPGWKTRIRTASSQNDIGLVDVWNVIHEFQNLMHENGQLETNRKKQAIEWMNALIQQRLKHTFFNTPEIKNKLKDTQSNVEAGKISPAEAANTLMEQFFNARNTNTAEP